MRTIPFDAIETMEKLNYHNLLHKKESAKVIEYTFKGNLIYLFKNKLSNDLRNLLRRDSNKIKEIPSNLDINLDAYEMLKLYLSIFNNQDSHIIRNESERIMNMTKYMKRVRILNELLSE